MKEKRGEQGDNEKILSRSYTGNDGEDHFRWSCEKGIDGCIYICERPDDAAKFVAIRGHEVIDVIELNLPEDKVIESYDHSIQFFGCRAFMYRGNVRLERNVTITEYSVQ